MRILLVSDREEHRLWGAWSPEVAKEMEEVDVILSAGDLSPYYLEFLVTMVNVPLYYVRGNHDTQYDVHPPEGCINVDEAVFEFDGVRIAGLGGSMKYKNSKDMYTEREMRGKVRSLKKAIRKKAFRDRLFRLTHREIESAQPDSGRAGQIDILLTHAPCRGYGDMEDIAHRGFECFNQLLDELQPAYHCYGHIHMEYGYGTARRIIEHPSGTTLINGCGMYIFDI